MQAGTAPSGNVETIPDFKFTQDTTLFGADGWDGSVVDFKVSRDLTGGGLPGAARGGSGFSVATGSVTLPMRPSELTPWAAAGKRVTPGGMAWLTAHPTTLTSLKLGRFLVDSCNAAALGGLNVELVESQRRMDGPFTFAYQYDKDAPKLDAVAVMAATANAGGFRTQWATPGPTDDVLLNFPGDGTYTNTGKGATLTRSTSQLGKWVSRDGQVMLADANVQFMPFDPVVFPAGSGPTVRVVVSGAPGATVTVSGGTTRWAIANTGVRVDIAGVGYSANFSGSPQSRAVKVTIRGGVIQATDMATGVVSTLRPDNAAQTMPPITLSQLRISTTDSFGKRSAARDVSVGIENPAVEGPPTAYLEHTGSDLEGVFDVAGKSGREVFQEVAAATMGAGWQSENGDLIYRNATNLRTGIPVETVVARDQLEDLPWDISRDNTADRIELNYTPAEVVYDVRRSLTLWEATEVMSVFGGATVTVKADIEGTADTLAEFKIMADPPESPDNVGYSRWLASTSPGGGGARPSSLDLDVSARMVGPSTAEIRIRNTTNRQLWLVDGNGNPCLILRTALHVRPGEQQTLEWGAPITQAMNPFAFDAGQWVQDTTQANQMLAWLADQLANPLPTITQVRMQPDLRRQLGDMVTLTDTGNGLKAKALIVGLDISGDKDGYQQSLSLAILAVTYDDAARWAAANWITTYDQLQAWFVTNGHATYDMAQTALAQGLATA